jgi:tetratricopeptide (TPR) repeat protein
MPPEARTRGDRLLRPGVALLALETVNAAYLAAFDSATIFYHANVVAHVVLGVPLGVWILARIARHAAAGLGDGLRGALGWTAALSALTLVGTGAYLSYRGTATPHRWALWAHVASFLVGAAALALRTYPGNRRLWTRAAAGAGLAVLFPLAVRGVFWAFPPAEHRIVNPPLPPLAASEEGAGEGTPFFPSSVRTVGDRLIPPDFFLESRSCGNKGCHPDIVSQWESSAHHFSSFNNQWYRKSIEYMQDVVGTKPSKWCGGCHDMAILFTGKMDRPIREQIHTPEAQAGIGCMACHSVVHVADSMGQGGYTIEYPEMHRLVASPNTLMRRLHDYMVRLDPQPHRKTLLKPFHRRQTAEFCSACHKVHLDAPVNHYRWFRGFNEYDAWQGSGVSGQGARAFYYPPQPKHCGTCHMPLVPSRDAANVRGFVHSHRFAAANSALPFVNGDEVQLEAVKQFLASGAVTVDIFGLREALDGAEEGGPAPAAAPGEGSAARAMIPGEEGVAGEAVAAGRRYGPLEAPLDRGDVVLPRGRTVRIEVVARTRDVGHAFPGGTIDAFDTWLELLAEDETGRLLGRSGWIEDGGSGPVEEGAHFYRSLLLDGRGNRINKRNAWAARALMYARVIPPGAADTVHFALRVPEDAGSRVTLTARLNYRKFAWWNTQWAFAGVRDPLHVGFDLSPHHDDGRWVFTGDTSDVSGIVKAIPDLPVVVVAQAEVTLPVGGPGARPAAAAALPGTAAAPVRERFNDYGIGLLLQRDLKGALDAFRRVVAIDPSYADGYVNIARALIEEGDHREAALELERALKLSPGLPKAHYFYALTLKAAGRYEEALSHLREAASAFPRDRAVLNQIGRILFLMRRHPEAVAALRKTLSVDPEDLQAHYNLMLAHRALGDAASARTHETLYARFKADEASQALTGPYRLAHPADNNERLLIHEHVLRRPGEPAYQLGLLR